MKVFYSSLLVLMTFVSAHAQDDESQSQQEFSMSPGIYLTFEDFIHNMPLSPEAIVTDYDIEKSDFYTLLFMEKKVQYISVDETKEFYPSGIWGYNDGKGIYMNRNIFPKGFFEPADLSTHQFAFINFLGRLSLVHYIKSFSNNNPYSLNYNRRQAKPMEFILDTRDGEIYKATL